MIENLFNRAEYSLVSSDVYDISRRITAIDKDYFILWNKRHQRYEIHHKGYPEFTFCLVVPFPELDERTLRLVWDTRAEKAKEIFAAMEKNNNHLEAKEDENFKDYVKWVGSEYYTYLSKYESKEVLDKDAWKTRWV